MWIKEEDTIRELFGVWSGSRAQVWEYVCGHGTLLVRFFRPNLKVSLFRQCKDCRNVRFASVGWTNASPQLRRKLNPIEHDEDFKFEITDGKSFYVACWGACLLESEKPVHLDWPPESRINSERWLLI